jgi:hypothetical protein
MCARLQPCRRQGLPVFVHVRHDPSESSILFRVFKVLKETWRLEVELRQAIHLLPLAHTPLTSEPTCILGHAHSPRCKSTPRVTLDDTSSDTCGRSLVLSCRAPYTRHPACGNRYPRQPYVTHWHMHADHTQSVTRTPQKSHTMHTQPDTCPA